MRLFKDMNNIIEDESASDNEKADAFLYKGLTVGTVAPYLTEFEEDETGLTYYIQGFKHNPLEIGILFNIINSFTDHNMRQEYTRNLGGATGTKARCVSLSKRSLIAKVPAIRPDQ